MLSNFQEDSSPKNKVRKFKTKDLTREDEIPRMVFEGRKVRHTDGNINYLNTSNRAHQWKGVGKKSDIVGFDFGTVGQKKEVFEGKIRDLGTIGGGGGRVKVKPTKIQPKASSNGGEKVDYGLITEGTPMGNIDFLPEHSLSNLKIMRLGGQILEK